MVNADAWKRIKSELDNEGVTLVAVSKTKPVSDIRSLYELGQRDFGENYVQELAEKQPQLPSDIQWHYIGHLQTNKVKYIAPFVHLIHAVDSFKLLNEINKQALKSNRTIDVLLQVYIADEDTKFGLDERELFELIERYRTGMQELSNIRMRGLMGMATMTENGTQIRAEFKKLNHIFRKLKQEYFSSTQYFNTVSLGMSGDYKIAIEEGSTMVRIGSLLFGEREYN